MFRDYLDIEIRIEAGANDGYPVSVRGPGGDARGTLKVLLTGADTPPQVQVERELREIQRALEGLGQQVAITVEPHLTRTFLQRRLREGFHVWHFVGHGGIGADGTTGAVLYFS